MNNDALHRRWDMPFWTEEILDDQRFSFLITQVFECDMCDRKGNLHPEYWTLYSEEPNLPQCPVCDGKHYYRREVDLRDALEILKGEANEPERNG